eukprot:gene42630-56663_t
MGPSGYNLFILDSEVVNNVGYFDENFFPAFFEDNDWSIRVTLWGKIRWTTYMDIAPWHGFKEDNSSSKVHNEYVSGTGYLSQ